jgi:hypothetical protein
VSVAPHTAGLRFAEGVVPTAHGDVSVAWKRDGRQFTLDVSTEAEQGIDVNLSAVGRPGATLTVDGKGITVWRGAAIRLPGGHHEILLQ